VILWSSGAQILQKFMNHLKIFVSECSHAAISIQKESQILGETVQNVVTMVTWCPAFLHPCYRLSDITIVTLHHVTTFLYNLNTTPWVCVCDFKICFDVMCTFTPQNPIWTLLLLSEQHHLCIVDFPVCSVHYITDNITWWADLIKSLIM